MGGPEIKQGPVLERYAGISVRDALISLGFSEEMIFRKYYGRGYVDWRLARNTRKRLYLSMSFSEDVDVRGLKNPCLSDQFFDVVLAPCDGMGLVGHVARERSFDGGKSFDRQSCLFAVTEEEVVRDHSTYARMKE